MGARPVSIPFGADRALLPRIRKRVSREDAKKEDAKKKARSIRREIPRLSVETMTVWDGWRLCRLFLFFASLRLCAKPLFEERSVTMRVEER